MDAKELQLFSELLGAKLAESLAAKLPEIIAAGIAIEAKRQAAAAEADRRAQSEHTITTMKANEAIAAHMENQDRAWEAKKKSDAIEEEARIFRARRERDDRLAALAEAAALGMPLDPSKLPPVPAYVPEPEPAPREEN
jgi:hypothetical protein